MGNSKWPFADDGNPGDADDLKELNKLLSTSPEDTETQLTLPRPLPPLPDGTPPDTRSERDALAELHSFFAVAGDGAEFSLLSLDDYDAATGTQPNIDQPKGD